MEAQLFYGINIEQVPSIKDSLVFQTFNDPQEIGGTEFIPFGSDEERIGTLQCIVLIFSEFYAISVERFHIRHGFGIEGGYGGADPGAGEGFGRRRARGARSGLKERMR